MKQVFCIIFVIILTPLITAANVAAFEAGLPVTCEINKECFIQNYPDADSSESYKNYRCGPHSYDGHKGTDFRVKNYVEIKKGYEVVATAPGVVRAVRDGMEDINVNLISIENIKGRECGNGVVIDHGMGWVTQYCHLKQNSITVHPGQEVNAGDTIGEIGMSGNTEFPHVHFDVRYNDIPIDPFTGKDIGNDECDPEHEIIAGIWDNAAKAKLSAYRPTHILSAGFSDKKPSPAEVRYCKNNTCATNFPANIPLFILWTDMIGILPGQTLEMKIISPVDGIEVLTHKHRFTDAKAQQFYFIGKKLKTSAWTEGGYTGEIRLIDKDGKVIDKKTVGVVLE